jgi:diguanylate cyclase (GGDEF)-like protein
MNQDFYAPSEYSPLRAEFLRILADRDIYTVFQPIFSLNDGEVLGYEALSRGPINSFFHSPVELIKFARLENSCFELDLLFRKKALEKIGNTGYDKYLFLNVDPNIMKDPQFKQGFTKEFLMEFGISPRSIVIEITEETAIEDYDQFCNLLKNYTDQGYMMAIDDVGSGYSGLKTIIEIRPHFIKIDKELIRNIDHDNFKQSMVKALVDISENSSIRLIAEGIETAEELKTLIRLGVQSGQGFFLQRPDTEMSNNLEHIKKIILDFNHTVKHMKSFSRDYHYIFDLIKNDKKFSPNEECSVIKEYFNNTSCSGVCIVEDDYPAGLIMRNRLDSQMAQKFGYSLYSKRSASLIMDKGPLIVDYYTPVHHVASRAMARKEEHIYDDIIVTKGSKYAGIVTMQKLIEYTLIYEKSYAHELNPLTSLPGNTVINRVIQDTIFYGNSSCILYLDLDNFKVYNDIYGFENGDKVIKLIADILQNIVKAMHPYNSFVGHIGGDDFIFIIESDTHSYFKICQEVISLFDKKILDFFSSKDKNNGYMESEDRYGIRRTFNLTSVSIVGIYGELNKLETPENLSQYISTLKKEAKKIPESNYIIKEIASDVLLASAK